MRVKDIPPAIRSEFFRYFNRIHDDEEDAAPPVEYFDPDYQGALGADECDESDDCFRKVGPERLAQIYREFLSQAPDWVRKIAADINQYEEDS